MNEREWTPQLGLQRALVHLAIRSAIALLLWGAVVWLATPVLNFLVPHWAIFGVTGLVLVAPGVTIGHALARNLSDIAGMTGLVLAVMAAGFGWGTVILGIMLADLIRPIGGWQYGITMMITGIWVTLWILRTTLLDS